MVPAPFDFCGHFLGLSLVALASAVVGAFAEAAAALGFAADAASAFGVQKSLATLAISSAGLLSSAEKRWSSRCSNQCKTYGSVAQPLRGTTREGMSDPCLAETPGSSRDSRGLRAEAEILGSTQ
jgi:hypothetical protein